MAIVIVIVIVTILVIIVAIVVIVIIISIIIMIFPSPLVLSLLVFGVLLVSAASVPSVLSLSSSLQSSSSFSWRSSLSSSSAGSSGRRVQLAKGHVERASLLPPQPGLRMARDFETPSPEEEPDVRILENPAGASDEDLLRRLPPGGLTRRRQTLHSLHLVHLYSARWALQGGMRSGGGRGSTSEGLQGAVAPRSRLGRRARGGAALRRRGAGIRAMGRAEARRFARRERHDGVLLVGQWSISPPPVVPGPTASWACGGTPRDRSKVEECPRRSALM